MSYVLEIMKSDDPRLEDFKIPFFLKYVGNELGAYDKPRITFKLNDLGHIQEWLSSLKYETDKDQSFVWETYLYYKDGVHHVVFFEQLSGKKIDEYTINLEISWPSIKSFDFTLPKSRAAPSWTYDTLPSGFLESFVPILQADSDLNSKSHQKRCPGDIRITYSIKIKTK